jgi:hypothetical protein
MHKRTGLVSRGTVALFTLIVLGGLSADRANAASVAVNLWVADGADLLGYGGTNDATLEVTQAAPSGGNYYSVTTYGASSTNEYVAVSDAANHTLIEYLWNGTSLTTPIGTGAFSFPSDPAGGAISPQEIAIDGSGNLWTTSAGGHVTQFCGNSSGCTVNSTSYSAGAVIQTVTVPTADGDPRGIMIDGSTVYVTTSSYGATGAGVYDFTINGSGVAGSLSTYYALVANTVGTGANKQETGQLRGITYTAGGEILWADSTWGASGTFKGYIDEDTGTTTSLASLNGPNALETGNGTNSNSGSSIYTGCNVLYLADYYSGIVDEISVGSAFGGCGSLGNTTTIVSGLTDVSGIALSVGEGGLGDDAVGPTGLFLSPDSPQTPEPGTFALMIGALLLAFGIGIRAQRRQLQ